METAEPETFERLRALPSIMISAEDCDEALGLIRMAIEQTCPAGVLASREMVNALYGPTPIHEAEALAKAIIATVEKLTK
ncbi:hypothetical protein [Mesorhizobium sp. B2-4-18]|uniref:hypothetical protein n=1 Tax=Mesorhizobium sp. B2-4-18 TaxID=2589931 RepID=UPI001FF01B25|nr:hypothetical protein [Mesorhizobium sp. B2-4-18]